MNELIVFAGLPGTGKSSIARALAQKMGAVWLRIDSIEQAVLQAGIEPHLLGGAGYDIAHAIAQDNLRLGLTVVADSVNPWMLTRNAWRDTGVRSGARVIEIETICSDLEEHRRRVEARSSDIPGLVPPDWAAVTRRDYHPWDRPHLTIDTSGLSVEDCVQRVIAAV